VANRIATTASPALKILTMTHKLPPTLALILLTVCVSSCFDNGQSAGSLSDPAPSVSPAPSADAAKKEAETSEPVMLKGPNAVPTDTRIIVNIPAFRMDVFQDGTLLRSYKVGIGYQQYPLPTGFRKAEQIIFNPTWTQPDEPWASDPVGITPAGAAGNPL